MCSCAGCRTAASRFPPVRPGGCPSRRRLVHEPGKIGKSWKNALPLGAVSAGVRNGEARRFKSSPGPQADPLLLGKLAVPPLAVTARRVRPAPGHGGPPKNRGNLQRQFSA
jgi:hypothetical protein